MFDTRKSRVVENIIVRIALMYTFRCTSVDARQKKKTATD